MIYSTAAIDIGHNGRAIGVFGCWFYYYSFYGSSPDYSCRVYRINLELDDIHPLHELIHNDFPDAPFLAGAVLSTCGAYFYAVRSRRTSDMTTLLKVQLEPLTVISEHSIGKQKVLSWKQ